MFIHLNPFTLRTAKLWWPVCIFPAPTGCEVPFLCYRKQNPFPLNPREQEDNEVDHLQLTIPSGSWPDDSGGLVEEAWLPGGSGRWWWAGCPLPWHLHYRSTICQYPPPISSLRHPWGDGPGWSSLSSMRAGEEDQFCLIIWPPASVYHWEAVTVKCEKGI